MATARQELSGAQERWQILSLSLMGILASKAGSNMLQGFSSVVSLLSEGAGKKCRAVVPAGQIASSCWSGEHAAVAAPSKVICTAPQLV